MQSSTLINLWRLLTPVEQRRALALLVMMVFGMLLETLGVGLVVPAVALMSRSGAMNRYPSAAAWLHNHGNPSRGQLLIAGMFVLVMVFALKGAFLALLTWRQMRFVHYLKAELSLRLFAAYLRRPYMFHLQHNSAQLIRNAITEVGDLTENGVLQALIFLTEGLVMIGILALLMYFEPIGALVAIGTLTLFGWGFYRIFRGRILQWGRARQLHDGMRIQHLQQGLGGAKEVKLLGREAEFIAQYQVHALGSARVGGSQQTIVMLPRLGLEVLAVFVLAVLVSVFIGRGRSPNDLLPILGLFAAAAFRVMPSANRMINAVQIMRNSTPVVEVVHQELGVARDDDSTPTVRQPVHFKHTLEFDDVYFWYPGVASPALSGLRLVISVGETIGIVGGSGAGKSTLVCLLLGLFAPTRGAIRVDDLDIQSNLRGWQDQLGYVPQAVFLTDDTLRRNIAFGISDMQIDDGAVNRAVRLAQLDRFIMDLPAGLDTRVGERGVRLSGGQLQRVGIARALYHDPDVLVLDEATSSLDTLTERGVMESVRALHGRKTIIIVSHRLSTVEQCDRLLRLEAGRIVGIGAPSQVLGTA